MQLQVFNFFLFSSLCAISNHSFVVRGEIFVFNQLGMFNTFAPNFRDSFYTVEVNGSSLVTVFCFLWLAE